MKIFQLGPRLQAVLLLALTAGAGVLGGIAMDRLLLRPPDAAVAATPPMAPPPPERPDRRDWRRSRQHFADQLTDDLDLTPEQRERVETLLEAQHTRLRAIMNEVRPRVRTVLKETRSGIKDVLTPAQRERFRDLRERRRRGAWRAGPNRRAHGHDGAVDDET